MGERLMVHSSGEAMFLALLIILSGIDFIQGIQPSSRQVQRCPDGYIIHGESCYRFYHSAFTWPEAFSLCKAFGSNLVTIESNSEKVFLEARAAELSGQNSNAIGYWTAGSDIIDDNEWVWAGNTEMVNIFDWAPGEPDPVLGRDCLGLWKDQGFKYGAFDCRSLLKPICEKTPVMDSVNVIG